MSRSTKSEWHDGQRRIIEAVKCIRENTALRTKFRSGSLYLSANAEGLHNCAIARVEIARLIPVFGRFKFQNFTSSKINFCPGWHMLQERYNSICKGFIGLLCKKMCNSRFLGKITYNTLGKYVHYK